MINKNTEKIIIKFLNRSSNSKDLNYLKKWLLNPENESLFEDYVRSHFEITIGVNEPDVEDIKEKLFKEIRRNKSLIYVLKSNPFYRLGAAAFIVLLLSLPFIVKISTAEIENTTVVVQENIKPGTDKATLTLEDGSVVALEKGASYETQNANSNGEEIIYNKSKQNVAKTAYNFLTIPRGGQFNITLSDGTKVWLNSETQLKYPVSFIEGETRNVELIYGEAYFEVTPSLDNKGAKFVVLNKSQKVEVLGTQFNIKAYLDETNVYTTLVEGKVAVNYDGRSQELTPNLQSNLNVLNNAISVAQVNVKNEISWIDGKFSFRNKPLKDIIKVISRWYDVEMVIKNKQIEDVTFRGVFGKNRNLEEILTTLQTLSLIKKYEINGKIITLE